MLKNNILKSTLLLILSLLFCTLIFLALNFTHNNPFFLQTEKTVQVINNNDYSECKLNLQSKNYNTTMTNNLVSEPFTLTYNTTKCINLFKYNNLNQENALNCAISFQNQKIDLAQITKNLPANENTNQKAPTLSFKTYIIVLLITLPIITVILLLIIPKKTDNLLALDLNKNKKNKVNLGMKIKHDDENL